MIYGGEDQQIINMAALHVDENTNNASLAGDGEAPPPTTAPHRLQGGRATTPFIIGTVFGLTLAGGGFFGNLIVLLIQEFNIKSIDAAQITNVVNGCINFFPLIGAIVADSFLGCFSVIWISSLFSLLGTILLLLTLKIDGLSPESKCRLQGTNMVCATPSRIQYGVLYSSLGLVSIGTGGTRFTLATMGANQFCKLKHQSSYFNWYFFTLYSASLISSTAIVYIEDNLGWGWGLGICIAANLFGLALFLMGSRYYIHDNPQTSPFTGLLRVVVASVRKRKMDISSQTSDYYHDDGDDVGVKRISSQPPSNWFRSLNRAALKKEGEIGADGSISKPWKLCSVEEVEDLKSIIRVLPLWSSSIFLSTPIGIQLSLTIVQALTTNRHVIHHLRFPPSSIIVFSFISTAITITLIHHCFLPLCKKLSAHRPTPLQLIGIGHVFNVASMAVSALVESHRRRAAGQISVAWLVPQMVIVGIGEAFHFPGQVGLYYQEFPKCLKSLATAMVAMLIGVAFYLSTAVVDLMRRVTDWLPDNINYGRVDNVYWVMVGIGIINFGYFLTISHFYTYNHVDHTVPAHHN